MRRVCVLLVLLGCDDGGLTVTADATRPVDAEPAMDARLDRDQGRPPEPMDGAPPDATPADAASLDAARVDAVVDATAGDMQAIDAARPDATPDAGQLDAGQLDAGRLDAAHLDAGELDAAPPDAAPPDQMLSPPRPAAPGDLVITELMIAPLAVRDTTGEWIEVANRAPDPIELAGLILTDGAEERAVVVAEGALAPGGYALLARDPDAAVNGGLVADGHYDGLRLSNRGDTVILETAAGERLDHFIYDADFAAMAGASMQFDADFALDADNADPTRWCPGRDPYGAGDLGTPGAPNPACRAAFTAAEFQQLIVETCPGCHTAAGRLGGLNLDDHTRVIDRPSVFLPEIDQIEPGDRMRSYLYLKLVDAHGAVGGRGGPMPPKVPLDADTIERVGRYIDSLPAR